MSQSDPAARYRAAGTLFLQKDFSGALSILDELIAANPSAAPLHFHRSRCLTALERDEQAAEALDTTLRLSPDHVPALVARAELGDVADNGFNALPLLQHAHAQEPDNAHLLLLLAEAELRYADTPEEAPYRAIAHLDRCLTLDPSHAQAWAMRGDLHHNRGSFLQEPGEHTFTDVMGVTYDRVALEAALHDYQQAAALDDGNHHDRRIAQIAATLGHYELATEHFDKLLARLPADAPGRVFLQEERDRVAQGETGAREYLAHMLEDAGTSKGERNLEDDMSYAITHSAAALVRQGQNIQSALEAVTGDESPEAMMATNIAFQLYNYANEPAPDLIEVSASDYPAFQRQHAEACEKALIPLGYTKLADAEALGITSSQGIRALIRIFVHPERGAAAAFAMKPKWPGLLGFLLMFFTGKWKVARMLECSTRFTDDFFMSSRAAGPDPFDNSGIANFSFEALPANATPQHVVQRHAERVEARVAQGHTVQPVTSLDDIEASWASTNQLKAEYRQSIGYASDEELRTILGKQYARLAEPVRERLKLFSN